jgi:hypothetical protein
MPRAPKKSESIEIRIPHAAKDAFMARCRAEGRSASESLRGYIERQIEDAPARRNTKRRWALTLGALAACGLAATALPTLARPSPRAAFEALDRDHDGAVSPSEFDRGARLTLNYGLGAADAAIREAAVRGAFARLDRDRDGRLELRELSRP